MENPNYQESAPSAPDPPPYFEKEPYDQQPPPAYVPANPAMPTQYQPYYAPYGPVPSLGPVVQPVHHTVFVLPAQPSIVPDYQGYSIFTLFCCLPLGIAALVYSIRTRDANRMGNSVAAQRNSRKAWIMAHFALGVGIVNIIIVCIYLL